MYDVVLAKTLWSKEKNEKKHDRQSKKHVTFYRFF